MDYTNDSKFELASKAQNEIFAKFDGGHQVKMIDMFKQLGLQTPPEISVKLAEYEKKIAEREFEASKKYNEKKLAQKQIQSQVSSEVKVYTEPNIDLEVDYESVMGSFDLVSLPSKGKVYKHKKDTLEVSFLTAIDESIFMQNNLSKTKQIFDLLLKNKILTKIDGEPIDVKTLHHGDKNAILLFLRANAFGTDYNVSIARENLEPLSATIDLTKIRVKELELESDENGLFDYEFTDTKTGETNLIKFKFFNDYDEDAIGARLNEDIRKGESIDYSDFYRSVQSVVSVNGIEDRKYIESFVKFMNPKDYRKYKNYVISNEPGIDFNYYLEKPVDSQGVESDSFPIYFNIGLDFFQYAD